MTHPLYNYFLNPQMCLYFVPVQTFGIPSEPRTSPHALYLLQPFYPQPSAPQPSALSPQTLTLLKASPISPQTSHLTNLTPRTRF